MIVAVRRALAGLALGLVVFFGATAATEALAETPSPAATATAKASATEKATATKASSAGESNSDSDSDTPDVAPDNSRQIVALGAAGALALVAAIVVFVRRR